MNAASLLGGDNLDAYNAELDKMQHASDGAGATQTALAKQMQSATFRIAKAKQSVAILATTLMGGLAPAIGAGADAMTNLIIKGVLPFTEVIGGALKGTLDWQKAVDKFPAPLQRTVHALGSVADSVGDVVRAFGDRGLTGAIRTLVQGGELEQIGTALGAIGSELLSFGGQAIDATFSFVAKWGGIVWGAATDAASWIKENAGDIAATGLNATVSFLTKWGGIIWGGALDAATWIKSNVPGLVANGVEATVDFVAKWGGIAWDTASDAGAWIKAQIGTISSSDVDATLSLLAQWGGIAWGAYGSANDWIVANVGPLTADLLVGLNMKLDPQAADDAYQSGHDIGKTGMEKFIDGLTAGFSDGGGGGGGGGAGSGGASAALQLPFKIQAMIDRFVGGVVVGMGEAAGSALKSAANPFTELPGIISNWFTDAMSSTTFGANGSQDPAQGFSAGQSPFDELSTIISNSLGAEIADIAKAIPGYKDDLVDAIKGVIPDSITLPGLKFDTSLVQGTIDGIKDKIDGWIEDLKSYWRRLEFWKDGGGEGAQALSFNQMSQNQGLVFGAGTFDATPITPGQGSMPNVTPAEQKRTVKIVGDNTDAKQKIAEIDTLGTTLAAKTFSGILDFDNGPAAVKYTDTFNWGTVFDAATFTSTFDIDNGPAAVAYTDAFGWGNTWASQVFTASFSVDTSGITNAVAVARQAAADIAAVMPHSPAKEGPLKEPITFDYIADNMRGVADRLRGYAASGAGYVRDSFTDGPAWSPATAAGRSGGGDTYIVITPDSEQFSEIARKARQGDLNWKTLSAIRQRMM